MKKFLFFSIIAIFIVCVPSQAQQVKSIQGYSGWRDMGSVPYPLTKTGLGNYTGNGLVFHVPFDADGVYDPSRVIVYILRPDGFLSAISPDEVQLPAKFFGGRPTEKDGLGIMYYTLPAQVKIVQKIIGSHSLEGGYEVRYCVIPSGSL